MIRRRFCTRPYDDRGTSLVLALVFITVGSLILMSVLALADTAVRSTIVLRNNTSELAAASGAANVAINTLRYSTYGGTGNCFGGSNTLALPNYYQRPNGTQDSVRVTCDLDPTPTSTTAPIGTPSRALLTLDSTATASLAGPIGIAVTNPQLTGSSGSLRVTGGVHSNSNIVIQPKVLIVPSGNLTSSGTIRANRACSSGSGLFSPNPTCNTGTVVADPAYQMPPVAGLPTRAVPPCGAVMTFQPGRYTDFLNLTQRASPTCASGNGVLHFTPGIYYFDFGSPDLVSVPWTWTLTAGTVIGGLLRSGVTAGPGMPIPNSCVSPVPTGPSWQAPPPTDGVTFVFSGGSQMLVSLAARVELCGRYAGQSPPLAVTAQPATGLLSTVCGSTLWPCAAISTTNPTAFVVQGTIYMPTRELVLGLNNTSNQALRGGAVVRRAWAVTTRLATSAAVIETPPDPYTVRRTIVVLNVYLCPGSSTCASGQLQLRTKVSIIDPSAIPVPGARQITVLSWSLQG